MKNKLLLFSNSVIFFVAVAALAICTVLLPELAREATVEDPSSASLNHTFLLGAYVLSLPFFVALFHTYRLVSYINKKEAFSSSAVNALRSIKRCSITFCVLMIVAVVAAVVALRATNPTEDVTHIIALGVIFTFIPGVIAVFIAVLQRLLEDAIAMKADNDLTV